jgi:hypothetical protein
MMTKEQALLILKESSENSKAHSIDKVKEALKIASTIVKPS